MHDLIFLIAYVGGTLGTLIDANILDRNKIRNLGAPVAGIGGAGTFDGIFLSDLIAVLLVCAKRHDWKGTNGKEL